ncbi:MAG TPA: hypothetical protein VGQ35_14585 [Dongiaceae bacterium]|jgi:hypothetical protein|nr:hypothetical protein [Dongiaceae bacterium]
MWGLRSWLIVLGVALIVLAAGGAWFLLREGPLPPIARDVDYASVDSNLVFGARVNQHYPIGMKVAELRAELKHDGFTLDKAIAPSGDGSARFVHANPLCRKEWSIAWQANAAGRIKAISGSFNRHCIWD